MIYTKLFTSSSFTVKRIENSPINSNCYLILKESTDNCIIVDPSFGNYVALEAKGIKIDYIILTHEHFDHIGSVEYLRKKNNCKVISTIACSDNISHPKKNLSIFYNQIGFSCASSDLHISENGFLLNWLDVGLRFYLTPGHSEGSLCFSVRNCLFTGDTIIKNRKTIVKLPGGSKEKLTESLQMIFKMHSAEFIVFPGHGETFKLSEVSIGSIL
ncbi:MAG TPA: MBL fold metallo-hydrolase [Segetibacter sp.]